MSLTQNPSLRRHHRTRPRSTAAAAVLVLLGVLTGCGDDGGAERAPSAVSTASNGDVYNGADVDFATGMIPHHAQAIEMVTLTAGRDLDPEVQAVADRIREAQAPEVEQMTDWLAAWGEEVPETSMDHANAHDEGHEGHGDDEANDMPGMMSADQMEELEAASDEEFERLFLTMMVEHHRGAIEMAQAEQEEGRFADAVALAGRIEQSQEAEIAELEALLGS